MCWWKCVCTVIRYSDTHRVTGRLQLIMRSHEIPITELSLSIHAFYSLVGRRSCETEHKHVCQQQWFKCDNFKSINIFCAKVYASQEKQGQVFHITRILQLNNPLLIIFYSLPFSLLHKVLDKLILFHVVFMLKKSQNIVLFPSFPSAASF